MSPKGCLTFAIVTLIVVWTAVMGGLIAAGLLGIEVIELVVTAVFGDTAEARSGIESVVGFVRGTAGGFLGLIWGLGTAALIALWLVAWRSVREVGEGGATITIRVDEDRAFREMKDVTPGRAKDLPRPRPDPGDEPR